MNDQHDEARYWMESPADLTDDDGASANRVECIYWRKASEEWPVGDDNVHVLVRRVGDCVRAGYYAPDFQMFVVSSHEYPDVDYWAYLPQGPAA